MKKGEIYEGIVEKVVFPNKGIVTIEDQKVIVKNTVPGQQVRFIINKKRRDRAEGRLLEVLERSDIETGDSLCSLFPDCGGCTYQTVGYAEQLDIKYGQVKSLLIPVLKEWGGLNDEEAEGVFAGIEGSPDVSCYRNKMEYSFGDMEKGGELMLGLHKKNSRFDVLPATDCMLVHDDINKIVNCVLEYCREKKLPYYHKMSHEGYLRYLLVRRAYYTGELIAALVTSSQMEHDLTELKERLCALEPDGKISGILHMTDDSVADVLKSEHTRILYGNDYFYEELLGLKFKITPFSFFQTNTRGAEILYENARQFIGDIKDAVVFDLYSGTGTIAQVLSPAAKKVIGVEIVEEAVEAAKENAALNKIENCEFLAGDVLKVIDEIDERPDYLILDPPREGINPKALGKLIAYNCDRIVYISCKPTSLANDLGAFLAGGYRVEKIKCVDMFPNTVHVETVVLMSKVNLDK